MDLTHIFVDWMVVGFLQRPFGKMEMSGRSRPFGGYQSWILSQTKHYRHHGKAGQGSGRSTDTGKYHTDGIFLRMNHC